MIIVIHWITIESVQTIVELPEYQRKAASLLGDDEKTDIINLLAKNPMAGVVIRGTGGVRKLRWGRSGKGKSSGVRVIYYYLNASMPLFLLAIFSKGEKANLSKGERNTLAGLTRVLKQNYERGT